MPKYLKTKEGSLESAVESVSTAKKDEGFASDAQRKAAFASGYKEPKNKKKEGVFNNITLSAVEKLTAEAWKIPYTIRVDSLSNFQYTYSVGDDLIVEDLVIDAESLSSLELSKKKEVSLEEPLLRNNLVTTNSAVTAINVVLQYTDLSLLEVPEAVRAARDLRQRMEVDFPDIKIHLTGVSMLNNAFSEVGLLDAGTLTPIMFIVILLISWLILRFIAGTIVIFLVVTQFAQSLLAFLLLRL